MEQHCAGQSSLQDLIRNFPLDRLVSVKTNPFLANMLKVWDEYRSKLALLGKDPSFIQFWNHARVSRITEIVGNQHLLYKLSLEVKLCKRLPFFHYLQLKHLLSI